MWADQALHKLITEYEFQTVLDVGCGNGEHALLFRKHGKHVTTISLTPPATYVGDFNGMLDLEHVDCIWASHVLEHQRNVAMFLGRCYDLLHDDGILAITVPPLKHQIVGGHLTLWNAGLLLYNLILAGFDCSDAAVKSYGYNISVIVRKKPAELPRLQMDGGDVERLMRFFPMKAEEGFNGQIEAINWEGAACPYQ